MLGNGDRDHCPPCGSGRPSERSSSAPGPGPASPSPSPRSAGSCLSKMRVDPNKTLGTGPGMWKSSVKVAKVVGTIAAPVSLSLPPAMAGRHRDPSLSPHPAPSVPLAWKCQHLTPASRLAVGTTLHSLLLQTCLRLPGFLRLLKINYQ